jgi:hypothetical protein
MTFDTAIFSEIIENIIKKIIHDFSNPISALINVSEIIRLKQEESKKENLLDDKLFDIFNSSLNSFQKKFNLLRYIFIDVNNISLNDEDEEIFLKIISEFEDKYNFSINFDFLKSEIIYKKIILFFLYTFSFFILKDTVLEIVSFNENYHKFIFYIDKLNIPKYNELLEINNFLSTEINFIIDKKFLNPIEVFIFYFKIFLKTSNFKVNLNNPENHLYEFILQKIT